MSLLKNTNIDSFIVSIKLSQKLLDVKAALAGLSIGKGDYGIYEGEAGLTSSKLQSVVRKGEITSIDGIIEKAGLYQVVGKKDNYSTIVVSLDNTMVVLYEENGQITMDLI
jgi:hypothetical protein